MDSVNIKKINTKNLTKNLENIKKMIKNKKICVMVKANAYGHGADKIVDALKYKVDFFGVFSLEEALKIKKTFKNIKILIVGKTFNYKKAIENNISFTICNTEELNKLIDVMNNYSLKEANVHLKINSGMNRFGVKSVSEFKNIYNLAIKNNINIEGVFTHFSAADVSYDITQNQKRVFNSFLKEIPKNQNPIIHVGGSEAIFDELNTLKSSKTYKEPKVHLEYDMLRVGIMIYGYGDKSILKLKKVMKIESQIVEIANVKKGEYIGYGLECQAKTNLTAAVVPIGYADGISRAFAKRGYLTIYKNGKSYKCKILGKICMDSTIIDITGAFEVNVGDKVVVLNNAEHMAKLINTISYEVLTNFNKLRQ